MMDEQVLALVIGRDELKTILVAEPVQGSMSRFPPREVGFCAAKATGADGNYDERRTAVAGRSPDLGWRCGHLRVLRAWRDGSRSEPSHAARSTLSATCTGDGVGGDIPARERGQVFAGRSHGCEGERTPTTEP